MKNIYGRDGWGRVCWMAVLAIAVVVAGCDDVVTNFGFSGNISGTMLDPAGNPVSGNQAMADFRVRVLGEGELEPMELRVKPDGTYQHTHLYPQVYSVWIEGPVVTQVTEANPLTIDLTGAPVVRDFTVTPFLTIATPSAGQPSGNSVQVSYDITANDGHTVGTGANRVLWASTATWPGPTTGNVVDRTHTIATQLPDNAGSVTVTGMQAGRTYYLRVGARATGTNLWNYSQQVSIVNP